MGKIKEIVIHDENEQKKQQKQPESKYEQALSLYNTDVDESEVKAAVEKLVTEKLPENNNPETLKFLLGSVELTSLHTTDTEESILAMVEKVNKFDSDYPDLPHVAAVRATTGLPSAPTPSCAAKPSLCCKRASCSASCSSTTRRTTSAPCAKSCRPTSSCSPTQRSAWAIIC